MLKEREVAERVARLLHNQGWNAWFVGGCVRDKLLGLEPSDYDVATDAPLSVVEEQITPLADGVPTRGTNYPVAKFKIGGFGIDVTSIKNGSLLDDTNRRDFTMNAMYEHPFTGEVIDLLDGQGDMRRGVLRGVGDVVAHMKDDKRRMVRAPRFASRLGYVIDADIWSASNECAQLVHDIDREWLAKECQSMAQGKFLHLAWAFLVWTGVLDHLPCTLVEECFASRGLRGLGATSSSENGWAVGNRLGGLPV